MEKSESPPLDNNNNQRHSKADDSESTHDSTLGDDITAAVILNVNSKLAASDNDGDLSSLNPVSHESCVNITTTSKANMSDSSSSCNNNNMNNTKQHIQQQQQHSTSSIGSKIHFSLFSKKRSRSGSSSSSSSTSTSSKDDSSIERRQKGKSHKRKHPHSIVRNVFADDSVSTSTSTAPLMTKIDFSLSNNNANTLTSTTATNATATKNISHTINTTPTTTGRFEMDAQLDTYSSSSTGSGFSSGESVSESEEEEFIASYGLMVETNTNPIMHINDGLHKTNNNNNNEYLNPTDGNTFATESNSTLINGNITPPIKDPVHILAENYNDTKGGDCQTISSPQDPSIFNEHEISKDTQLSTTANTASTANTSPTQMQQQQQQQQPENSKIKTQQQQVNSSSPTQQQQQQQPGWRVKLYCLNSDGSWDDCGTGRIVCSFSSHHNTNTNTTTPASPNSKNKEISILDQQTGIIDKQEDGIGFTSNLKRGTFNQENSEWALLETMYQELGEPTLCMHAEIPNSNAQQQQSHDHNQSSINNRNPKVLLRTRVLLRESYQRQGDNIITWCEPFLSTPSFKVSSQQNHRGRDDQPAVVDLALSFQDNAGCLDIWNKITTIQRKCAERLEERGIKLFELNNRRTNSEVTDNQSTNQNGTYDATKDVSKQNNNINNQYNRNDSSVFGDNVDEESGNMGGQCGNTNSSADIVHSVLDTQHNHLHQNNQGLWMNEDEENRRLERNSLINDIKYDVDEREEHQFTANDTGVSTISSHYIKNNMTSQTHSFNSHHIISSEQIDSCQTAIISQLPNPPTISNLQRIAEVIAAAQPHQREIIAQFMSQHNGAYFKSLLSIFPLAENEDDNDMYDVLATLASIIKTIILFNDPSIIQLVSSDCGVFESCCCCLEYDPDLRAKANHRWFIQNRLKFRTVVLMEDQELIDTIHKSFRVTYLRDTLLRPTMDENSLSTLGSLLNFTHADVVKGVMCNPPITDNSRKSNESYLVQVLKLLGREIFAICEIEWRNLINQKPPETLSCSDQYNYTVIELTHDETNVSKTLSSATSWKQHLAPQDKSIKSRKIRRRGCLNFLKELFNMVRSSFQQHEKDDFYTMIVLMDFNITESITEQLHQDSSSKKEGKRNSFQLNKTSNLLSLLGIILSDHNTDISERGACLEILSAIAMHNPGLIRKHCREEFTSAENERGSSNLNLGENSVIPRPQPNSRKEVVFCCPPNNLLLSLVYLMAIETDVGILLQTSEMLRCILDSDMMNELHLQGGVAIIDNQDELLVGGSGNGSFQWGNNYAGGGSCVGSELNTFLQMFYDHYVPWLVAPFQYSILITRVALPDSSLLNYNRSSKTAESIHEQILNDNVLRKDLLQSVPLCAVRASFSIELLSFCIRAHCYRMKRFLLSSKVLSNVLRLLQPSPTTPTLSGDRCLKLAALRCLRSILTLKDDFYHRHIVNQNLFAPVFETFRANPVGDNLVSSAIIEMCDFIKNENIKSLIEYIVNKHLIQNTAPKETVDAYGRHLLSLEDVATPYVDTLTQLREKYEENNYNKKISRGGHLDNRTGNNNEMSGHRVAMNEKAMEDQRKFLEVDEEESYFDDDDDSNSNSRIIQVVRQSPSHDPESSTEQNTEDNELNHHSFLGITTDS